MSMDAVPREHPALYKTEEELLNSARVVFRHTDGLLQRFSAMSRLTRPDVEKIERAVGMARHIPAGTELVREGDAPPEPSILLSGWIAHQRILQDGRRQIARFTLAGEIFGRISQWQENALTSQVALDNLIVCPAPKAEDSPGFLHVYAMEQITQRLRLLDNITRLGRMNARERLCDLLLEFLERLQLAGRAQGNTFSIPLTQEYFSDALGLTPVHLNRTLQACRHHNELTWRNGKVTLHDPASLALRVGRKKSEFGPEPRALNGRSEIGRTGFSAASASVR